MKTKSTKLTFPQLHSQELKMNSRFGLSQFRIISLISTLFMIAIGALQAGATEESKYKYLLSIISSPLPEYGLVISPSGNVAVFSRMSDAWGSRNNRSTLYVTHKNNDDWAMPKPLFDNSFKTTDPYFSQDGKTLFFTTNQAPNGTKKTDTDIWKVDHKAGKFTNARPVYGVNSDAVESSPVVSANGNIYFSSRRPGGVGAGDIWMARFVNGAYQSPQNLGAPVNEATGEWNLFVDKDERYLLIEASGRKGAKSGSGDIYLYRKMADEWSEATPLAHINTAGSDLMPRITSDGEGFFYTSSGTATSKNTEIYYKSALDFLPASIDRLKRSLIVVSRSNHEIVALDPDSLKVVARYATGKGPHEVAASNDGKIIYTPAYGVYPRPHTEPILPSQMQFTSEPPDTLSRISTTPSDHQNSEFPICQRSHGVIITPDTHVWVTCQNESRVMELDGQTGALIKNWPLGVEGSHILVATRDNKHVITSNVSSGSISILNRETNTIKTIQTGSGAEGLALDPSNENVWVGNTQENTISVVKINDGTIVNEFSSHGRFPVKMTVIKHASEVWVVNTFSREISILGLDSGNLIEKMTFASPPLGIHSSPDGEAVYVTFPRLNEVRAFNQKTREEIARTNQIMEGDGMAWAVVPY